MRGARPRRRSRRSRTSSMRSECPAPSHSIPRSAMAPLPRAYQWADGSAYVNHVELVRKARGAAMPPEFWTDPLMYQGASDHMLGACDDIVLADEAWGIDFEAEVAVVTDDVPMGTIAADARRHIVLLMLVNDVSLRHLIPAELAKGFGFFQSKPASAFSPVAVTPDELGGAWHDGKVHLPLVSHLNGHLVRPPQRRRGHDVRLRDADRPCGKDARARGGQHRRLGDRVQQGGRRVRAGRRRPEGWAIRASPSSGPSRRWSAERRRLRSCASATACASRCTTGAAGRCLAPSTRRCVLRVDADVGPRAGFVARRARFITTGRP